MKVLVFIWVCFIVLDVVDSPFVCNPAEYRIRDECCPMCSPGNKVYKHCTEYTSTSCVPCIGSTYLDEPNGLTACLQCSNCDPGFGLKVKQPCTPTSDAVCEPLEEFYCTDATKDGCKAAQRHSTCKPGQYISQKGTTSKDTECADCTGDSYSDGSFTSCQPHRKCETLKLEQITPGTSWSDSECGTPTFHTTIVVSAVVTVLVILTVIGAGIVLKLRLSRKHQAVPMDLPPYNNRDDAVRTA